jgi:signal peptidase I
MSRSDMKGSDADLESAAEEPSTGEAIREQVVTLVIAIAIALSIRAFVVEPFRIPSGSMLPTLLIGDHLFVNKFVYGVKIPFTDVRLPGIREPERGDVVVFTVARSRDRMGGSRIVPADRRPDLSTEDFVKRIVALPGDRVEVRKDKLYVNGNAVSATPIDGGFVDERGDSLDIYGEDLGACEHAILDDPNKYGLSQTAFTVEPGRYFFMGDNRDNSNDSRGWGTVRLEEFKGPAFILYRSWDTSGSFLQLLNPVNWFTVEKRWGRILKRVKCGSLEGETFT